MTVVIQTLAFGYDEEHEASAHGQAVENDRRLDPAYGPRRQAAEEDGGGEAADHRMADEAPPRPQGRPSAPQWAIDRPERPLDRAHHKATYRRLPYLLLA
ncbi:hypothetical protein ACFV29_22115 [Streptomyces sp. NPDC059690]|uniref:hypothetical protein n=1 Tax=Streptomyces sp. NPDC059690 TaxID=3346907 RepID=UPI0036C41C5C